MFLEAGMVGQAKTPCIYVSEWTVSRVETQTGRSISTLPIDDRARSSAIRDDSQVEEAARICIIWNDFSVSLGESQGTVALT
jgi:hypothetical protein